MSVRRLVVVLALLFSFVGAVALPAFADVIIYSPTEICHWIPAAGPHRLVPVSEC